MFNKLNNLLNSVIEIYKNRNTTPNDAALIYPVVASPLTMQEYIDEKDSNDNGNSINLDFKEPNLITINNCMIKNMHKINRESTKTELLMPQHIDELKTNGYTIIHNVYNENEISEYKNEFKNWLDSIPFLKEMHESIDFHGIFKHHQVGHQRFAWLARTNTKITNIFKKIWNTDKLVCSFDGCCYYSKEYYGEPQFWIHTDQSSQKKGLWCYQSFLSLTSNLERTLVLYKSSHLLHEEYFKTMKIDNPSDWHILDENYVQNLKNEKVYVDVSAGDLVIWDSRTFHQNTAGTPSCEEERLIQYLCYLPKNAPLNTDKENELRELFFNDKRTTNHGPYPMSPVPEQPYRYNHYFPQNKVYIDYDKLPEPHLEDLMPKIRDLL
jgi:hypothetical protein